MKVSRLSKRVSDINGWYEVKDNPLSKVGVFDYLGSSIDADGSMGLDPNKIYKVYRPEEELASAECVDSFKLLPWINNHEMLGAGLTPAEEKGVEGVIGETVYFDASDKTLKGNIKVFSESLKGSIDYGKDELSCGYRCKYTLESGNFNGERYDVTQREIRGNHVASVDQGRMGPEVAVQDHRLTFTVDSKEFAAMQPEDMKEEEGTATADMSLADVTKVLGEIMPQIEALNKAMMGGAGEEMDSEEEDEDMKAEDMKAEDSEKDEDEKGEGMDSVDAENKALKAQVAKLQTSMDAMESDGVKNLMGQIAKRDSLAGKLSAHVGAFDHSEMTLGEVAKYGVEKLGIACDSGSEVATLNGYLHQRSAAPQANSMDSAPASSELNSYLGGGK